MSGFEVYRGKGNTAGHAGVPMVSVAPRKLYPNQVLREQILDTGHVEFLLGEDGKVGLRPVDDETPHAYSLHNRSLTATNLYKDLGVEVEEATTIEVDTESEDFPVVDLSPFIDGESGETVEPGPDVEADAEELLEEMEAVEDEERDDEATENGTVDTAEELRELSPVGSATERKLRSAGIESVADVREGGRSALLEVPGVGSKMADRMLREAGAEPDTSESDETDESGDEPLLDTERVETALESVGVPVEVSAMDLVRAIDANSKTYAVARDLDISRGGAADLVYRLDLEDALDADDGLAEARFNGGDGS